MESHRPSMYSQHHSKVQGPGVVYSTDSISWPAVGERHRTGIWREFLGSQVTKTLQLQEKILPFCCDQNLLATFSLTGP
jgi:hypothetical protein